MADDGDEEELSIDFSKLLSIFSGKKKKKKSSKLSKLRNTTITAHSEEHEGEEPEGASERIAGGRLHKHKKRKAHDEVSIDFKAIGQFLLKYKTVILLLIPLILCVYLRMIPADAPYTEEWARTSVADYYKSQIRAQINEQYPNLPDANKNALVEEEFQRLQKGQGQTMDQQIKQTADYYRSVLQDENGNYYMPDIDPYYWFRYAKNILEHGHPGDILKVNPADGKTYPYDNHQLAPLGRPVSSDMFHSYFLANFYRVIHIFNSNLDLMRSMFYYPVLISALSIIPIFFITRRIAGDIGGFLAATMVAINPSLLGRTLLGHADSDAFVVFFPIMITWLFFEALETRKTWVRIALSALAGLFTGLYSLAWSGWSYIYDFLLISALIYAAGVLVLYRDRLIAGRFKAIKRRILHLATVVLAFVASSGVFVSIFRDTYTFIRNPIQLLGFTQLKVPVRPNLWPNVLTTVAELNPGSLDQIINSVGGQFLFSIAIVGIVAILTSEERKERDFWFIIASLFYLGLAQAVFKPNELGLVNFFAIYTLPVIVKAILVLKDKERGTDIKAAALITMWFMGTVYASTKGIRFTVLLVPAFSIAFGSALGVTHSYVSNIVSRELNINRWLTTALLIFLLSLAFFFPRNIYRDSVNIAANDVPIVNDAWYNALTKIRENSSEDAIISSWWDFGHHFKALADRPVTFDGTTQDYPQAHWIGRMLVTSDEDQAVGILRMLDCGGNTAFDELERIVNDTPKSVKILYQVIEPHEREAAKAVLNRNGLTDEQADKVLQYTHCKPPEAFVIASDDMISKSGVWAHFGSWDFERAAIWQFLRNKPEDEAIAYMVERFNYSREHAEDMYYQVKAIKSDGEANTWVAPWPSYASGLSSCTKTGDILSCGNGVVVNLTTQDAYFDTPQGRLRPRVYAYATKDGMSLREYNESVLTTQDGRELGVTLFPKDGTYQSLLSSYQLAGGMFTRMFYMEGHGLRHFKLLGHERSAVGTEVYVWRVDWEGSEMNTLPDLLKMSGAWKAADGDSVSLNYIGYLDNGTVFDSTIKGWSPLGVTKDNNFEDFEYEPFSFRLGEGRVIPGFEDAVRGMMVNETKNVRIPPEEAYGVDTQHPLSNQTLNFKISVVAIDGFD
ncbi:hypothetical protein COT48_05300 [Candidatus Woesearchaeota archaeon CG08_land_8_20_14_0_20_47_9]|nr:MAG: hypothetical protein COT48_05300 [Candidatus Woesearchaeota archaeon CG08_land_8_20_14_0_20_47_9]